MYLLSRALDPLLGVFTGVVAFTLHQNNPRTAPGGGEKLSELLWWKWTLMRQEQLRSMEPLQS